jgi:hypothetical protein
METQKRQRNELLSSCIKRAKFSPSRTESVDTDTLEYLLCLILSHEQHQTPAPEWLVSKEPYDECSEVTKGEKIKSQILRLYQGTKKEYVYQYKQKEDKDGKYGGWILKNASDYFTSAHAMKRELRANLFHKNYHDVDIVNAFPSLLLGKLVSLQWNPLDYQYLKKYVIERDVVLKENMEEKGCDRSTSKGVILALMFKDPSQKWSGLSTFEKKFEHEMESIADKLLRDETINWVARSPGKHKGAGLSVLLQTLCASCLEQGVMELERQGCHVGALIFDGCLVEKYNSFTQVLNHVNKAIQKIPMYQYVTFVVKPFADIVDTSVVLPVTYIRNDFNNNMTHKLPMSWDEIAPKRDLEFATVREWLVYKDTLVNRMNTRFAMISQGSSFQKTMIMEKINSKIDPTTGTAKFPGYQYITKSDRDSFLYHGNQVITVTVKELIDANTRLPKFSTKTGSATYNLLSGIWVVGRRNSYPIMDYNPVALGQRGCVNERTFNTFYGFQISREKAAIAVKNGGDPNLILKFIKELVGDDTRVFKFVLQWMGFLVQYPAEIPGVMLVFQSAKGVGKSLLYNVLELILGSVNCDSISEIGHLIGKFNDKRKNKKLVALEEIGSMVYDPKNWGKCKDMITNPTQGFNGKHKAIEDSYAPTAFMQFTNDDHCVRVDDDGIRRIYLVKCSNYWSYKQCQRDGRINEREKKFESFKRKVFADLEGCLSAFANYLYTLPLKQNYGKPVRLEHYNPVCPALYEQTIRSLTLPAQMVMNWIEGGRLRKGEHRTSVLHAAGSSSRLDIEYHTFAISNRTWVSKNAVYSEYLRLCKEQHKSKPTSSQNFWMDLRKYVDLGMHKEKTVDGSRIRGIVFPSRQDMLKAFKRCVPDYDFDLSNVTSTSEE